MGRKGKGGDDVGWVGTLVPVKALGGAHAGDLLSSVQTSLAPSSRKSVRSKNFFEARAFPASLTHWASRPRDGYHMP